MEYQMALKAAVRSVLQQAEVEQGNRSAAHEELLDATVRALKLEVKEAHVAGGRAVEIELRKHRDEEALLREEIQILEEECLRLEKEAHTNHKKYLAGQHDLKMLHGTNQALTKRIEALGAEAEGSCWSSQEWTAELQRRDDQIVFLQGRLNTLEGEYETKLVCAEKALDARSRKVQEQEAAWEAKLLRQEARYHGLEKAAATAAERQKGAEERLHRLQPYLDVEDLPTTHPLRALGWRAIKQAEERAERAEAREHREKRRRHTAEARLAHLSAEEEDLHEARNDQERPVGREEAEMSEGSQGLDAWGVESRQHSSRSTGFEALPESLSPTLRRSSLEQLEALAGSDEPHDASAVAMPPTSGSRPLLALGREGWDGSSRSSVNEATPRDLFGSYGRGSEEADERARRRDEWRASPAGSKQRDSVLGFYQQSIDRIAADEEAEDEDEGWFNPFGEAAHGLRR